MWILKNSTNLMSSFSHLGVRKATSIQTFDFSTLYTSIPHDLLKSRMNSIINNAFKHKTGDARSHHMALVIRPLLQGYKVNHLSNTFRNSMADKLIWLDNT